MPFPWPDEESRHKHQKQANEESLLIKLFNQQHEQQQN